MSSIRLYRRQIERFAPGTGARVIAFAVRRYRAGELVIHSDQCATDNENVLQLFPIRNKPQLPDSTIRNILDAHFNTPRPELERGIGVLDRDIERMMAQLPPYVIEEGEL